MYSKGKKVTTMYRVVFIYAPYPTRTFKKMEDAVAFKESHVAASKIEKRTFFGKWKAC